MTLASDLDKAEFSHWHSNELLTHTEQYNALEQKQGAI